MWKVIFASDFLFFRSVHGFLFLSRSLLFFVLIVLNFPTYNPLRIRLCANLTLSNVIAANSIVASPLNVIQFSFCHFNQLKFSNYDRVFSFTFALDSFLWSKAGGWWRKNSQRERERVSKKEIGIKLCTHQIPSRSSFGCVILPLRFDWFKVLLWKYKSADYQSNMFRLNTFTLCYKIRTATEWTREKKLFHFYFVLLSRVRIQIIIESEKKTHTQKVPVRIAERTHKRTYIMARWAWWWCLFNIDSNHMGSFVYA